MHLFLRARLVALIAALLAETVSFTAVAAPNILYINADDLGVMDVGYNDSRYSNSRNKQSRYNTPNIDRLVEQGMVFSEAYAPAATNCAPSRASVMSGQSTPRHGVYTVKNSDRGAARDRKIVPIKNTLYLTEEQVTIAEELKTGGYNTIHLGKWHASLDPLTQGFDINIGGDKEGGPKAVILYRLSGVS